MNSNNYWEQVKSDLIYQMDKRQQENIRAEAERTEAIGKVMALLFVAVLIGGITAGVVKFFNTHNVVLRNPILIEEIKQVEELSAEEKILSEFEYKGGKQIIESFEYQEKKRKEQEMLIN